MSRITLELNIKKSESFSTGGQTLVAGRFDLLPQKISNNWQSLGTGVFMHVESGMLEVKTQKEARVLSSGCTFYIPPKMPHVQNAAGARVSGWFLRLPVVQGSYLPEHETAFAITDLLMAICRRAVSIGGFRMEDDHHRRLVHVLFDEIGSLRTETHLNIPIPRTGALAAVAGKILQDPGDMQSINHWAHAAAMCRRSFTKRFKEETGLTFSIWRQRVKLIAAIKMLQTGRSNTDIAVTLGYKNASTFNVVFSKQFGMSPGRYIRAGYLTPPMSEGPVVSAQEP